MQPPLNMADEDANTPEELAIPITRCVYTPITEADPLKWSRTQHPGISGRQHPKDIRVVIGVTVYNEEGHELSESLKAVAKNIAVMNAWPPALRIRPEEVLVVIVCDGVAKLSLSLELLLERLLEGVELTSSSDFQGELPSLTYGSGSSVSASNPPEPSTHQSNAQASGAGATACVRTPVPKDAAKADLVQRLDSQEEAPRVALQKVLGSFADTFASARGEALQVHSFEWTARMRVLPSEVWTKQHAEADLRRHMSLPAGQILSPPMQFHALIKQNNGGKIHSHELLFRGLCRSLDPQLVLMLDAGTVPNDDAIALLVKHMHEYPDCGGVTGSLAVRDLSYLSFLQSIQHMDYRTSQNLDKCLESELGFISVLPGAFSLYRWQAIVGEPLQQYFAMEDKPKLEKSTFLKNVYIAEDRVLAVALVGKTAERWSLAYEPKAVASTDVPDTYRALLSQRRRWQNGGFFAMLFALRYSWRFFFKAHHSFGRKVLLAWQWVHNCLNIMLTWFGSSVLYLALAVMFTQFLQPFVTDYLDLSDSVARMVTYGYHVVAGSTLLILICAAVLGNANKHVLLFKLVGAMLGIIGVIAVVLGVASWFTGDGEWYIAAAAISAVLVVVISGLAHGQTASTIIPLPAYILAWPTFSVVFVLYSFARCNDLSWGNRPAEPDAAADSEAKRKKKLQRHYTWFRNGLLTAWMVSNAGLVFAVLHFNQLTLFGMVLGAVLFLGIFNRLAGLAAFFCRRRCRTFTQGVWRPPMAQQVEQQQGTCLYKLDHLTGKLQACHRRRTYFAHDWIWKANHGQLDERMVYRELRDDPFGRRHLLHYKPEGSAVTHA